MLVKYDTYKKLIRFVFSEAKDGLFFQSFPQMIEAFKQEKDVAFGVNEIEEIKERFLRMEKGEDRAKSLTKLYNDYIAFCEDQKPNFEFASVNLWLIKKYCGKLFEKIDKNKTYTKVPVDYEVNDEITKRYKYPKNRAAIQLYNTLLASAAKSEDTATFYVDYIPFIRNVEIKSVYIIVDVEEFDEQGERDAEAARKVRRNEKAKAKRNKK